MNKKLLNQVLTFTLILLCLSAYGQEKLVTGTITASDGSPLPGTSIVIKDTSVGTDSDFNGNYSIKANTGAVLVFSYVGFISQEITVTNQLVINVTLEENASILDEVVVTGYGKQSRAKLTTSVAKLDTQVLESATMSNAGAALQGIVAGLRVTNTTGQPGASPNIVLRGGTNFGSGDSPLILVDGVQSSFYALNSDDIESIEVLKDAAATAIYGARSANGVILVTTKTGKAGTSSINFRSKYSINEERDDQQYVGAEGHINNNRQSIKNYVDAGGSGWLGGLFLNGPYSAALGGNTTNSSYTTQLLTDANSYLLAHEGWKSIPDVLDPSKQILFYDNKGVNDRIYQESHTKDHYLSFDGGNEKGTYYLGLGALDNEGISLKTGFKRYSAKFNGSYKISDDIKVNSNVIYSSSRLSLSPLGNDGTVFRRFQGQAPTARTFDSNPDGTLSDTYSVGDNQGFGNPLYYQDKFVRKNLMQQLSASIGMDWSILDDLTFSVNASHFTYNNHKSSFDKAYQKGSTSNPFITTRTARVSLARVLRNQITGTLNYTKQIGDHNFNALLGTEYFKNNQFSTNAATRNAPSDLIETLNAGAEASGKPYSGETEYALVSAFGRLTYDYDAKYLVGLTFRNDGSSRLGNNKYGFFPGVSLGWNAHNEDFFTNSSLSKIVDRLKPRVSYGVSGNQDVLSNYGVFGLYQGQGVYNGQTGYANTRLATLGLLWERATTVNVGLDLSLFNNRVSLIADVYSRDTENKLANQQLPAYTGFTSVLTNNGTYRNKGYELQINGDIIRNNDLTWNVGATFTSNKNYVVSLPENANDLNRQGGTLIYNPVTGEEEYVGGLQEGQRYGGDLIVAFEQAGIYATQAEADADNGITDQYVVKKNTRYAGDVKWVDQNGDNIIDGLDRKVIGRTTPDFVGGFTTNLKYKNFNLFVKTDFATGHLVWNHLRQKGYAQTQGNLAQPIEMNDAWSPTNTNTDWPRMVFVNGQKNVWRGNEGSWSLQNYGNSQFWEKGDYLALREVTLNYNVPTKFFNNTIKKLNIYATGSNLLYIKSMSGDTPEIGGVQYGNFPMPKTYTLGINITL